MKITKHIDELWDDRWELLNPNTSLSIYDFISRYADEMEVFLGADKNGYIKHRGLIGNISTHPHQIFLCYPKRNIGLAYDPITNKVCTVLYLDGRNGYTGETVEEWRERTNNN